MDLKYEIKSVITVDYDDLDEFLTKRFNLPEDYEVVAMEELGNDMVKSIDVSKKELDKYDQRYIDAITKDKEVELYNTGVLLCHLCNLGEIPEGEYLIEISW
jgi:hypothetical protein